jgi:VCBS repeat-containing protein
VNDAPTTTGLVNQAGVDAQSFSYNTGTAFSDIEGDTLSFAASGLPAGLSIDPVTGVISGTLPNDASVGGPYNVTVTADDGNGGTTSANFTLTVSNPPPYVIGPSTVPVYVDSNGSGGYNPGEDNSTFSNGTIASGTGTVHVRAFDLPAGAETDDARILVTLTTLDNSGTILVNGTNLSPTGSFEFEAANFNSAADTAAGRTDTQVRFPDGSTMSQPWVANTNGLPRIQFVITENGVEIWGTRTPGSTSLELMELASGTFNLPTLTSGQNSVTVINFNDNGPDGINGSIAVTHDPLANQRFGEGATVSFGTADNFADPDGDTLTYSATGLPAGLSIDPATGIISGAVGTSAAGTYTVSVTADDGQGGTATDSFTITIFAVNNPPVAIPDNGTIAEDTASTAGNVVANDSDPEGAPIAVTQVNGSAANVGAALAAAYGTLVLNSSGAYTYTLNNASPTVQALGVGESLTETFTYQITAGGQTANATLTITINGTNDVPNVGADSFTTPEDTKVSGSVAGNDSDIDGDSLTYALVSGPVAGLTFNSDGSFDYTPAANANGTVTFTYQVDDGKGGTATATVTINVTPVNDAPVANDDSFTTAEDTKVSGSVAGNDSDVDGDTLTYSLIGGPVAGLTFNSNGTFDYTPAANANGTVTFQYQVSDGKGGTDTATVTIDVTPVNDAPVALDNAYSTAEDTPLIVAVPGLLGNDTDIDGDTLIPSVVSGPTNGALALNADGSFTYTPNADYNGPDFFTYQVSDGKGGTDTATVTIDVAPVNDAPAAVDDGYQVAEDGVLVIGGQGVLTNDSDADGDGMSASLVSGPANGSLTLNADGTFTYTPNANFNGTDSFTYQAADGKGGADTATVTIDVVAVTDQPVAIDDSVTVDESSKGGGAGSSNVINVVVILDRSGSMGADPDGAGGFATRLALAQSAINNMLATYGANGPINVLVVAFNDTTSTSGWLTGSDSVANAQSYVNGITQGGGTNYSSAIGTTQAAYSQNTPPSDDTVVYFITDGVPTAGTSLSSTNTVAVWESFLTSNGISNAYAIGVNSGGIASGPLDDVAYPGAPTIITNETQLPTVLNGTVSPVTNTVSGDVDLNDSYGPDGPGYVQSLQIGATTYTYNQGTNQISDGVGTFAGPTLTQATPLGGQLTFNFLTGQYTYTAPEVTANTSESFNYVITSSTGGTDGATLTVNIRNVTRAPLTDSRVLWVPDDLALIPTPQGYAVLAAPPIDPDGDPVTITITSTPAEGTLYYDSTGAGTWVALPQGPQSTVLTGSQFASLRYLPDGDGTAETLAVTYTATDGTLTTVGTIAVNTLIAAPGVAVLAGAQDDTIYGTPNADTLSGGGGSDVILGGVGDDVLSGGDGADRLEGGDGNDVIIGGAGNDSLVGGNGNDTLAVDTGTDVIDGGANIDVLDFTAGTAAVNYTVIQSASDTTVNFAGIGLGTVVYRNIEGALGTGFNDTLTGTNNVDILGGGGGNDTLTGNNGNDTIDGGTGDDSLNGGANNDLLTGGDGNDTLIGGSGTDVISGGLGSDSLDGGTGDDTMTGGGGNDTINVSSGNDRVRYVSVADALDSIVAFDNSGGSGAQDFIDLDGLFDSLGVAAGSRAARVSFVDTGADVDLRLDTDGNGSFETTLLTFLGLPNTGGLSVGAGVNDDVQVGS